MLLRQALEQTRAGMPTLVLFNSRIVALDHTDEVFAMVQNELFDAHFHAIHSRASIGSFPNGSAGQVSQATGAQAS
jgi:hypothetical protein